VDSRSIKPDGIDKFSRCLKVVLTAMRKNGPADVIVCGSEKVADLIRRSLDQIRDDAHIIIDSQSISERNWYITSHQALSMFPAGENN